MSADVETRAVTADDVADLAELFDAERTTRRCWCMAFCAPRAQFAAGWFGGGNRRRFEAMATGSATPMGILASTGGRPVGWCACGPGARYATATRSRSSIVTNRVRAEDETVWLLPCIFVRAGHRGVGISHALVAAAVDLARDHGAAAIEGWPLSASAGRAADAFVGREQVFTDLDFTCVERPTADRVVVRLAFEQ